MNLKPLLEKAVQDWILENENQDVYTLIFSKSPFPEISMQMLVQQVYARQKFKKKVPFLAQGKMLIFPPKINVEQTSSWDTAMYKARLFKGGKCIDITGGLGVDSMAFAQVFAQVEHVEKNKELQNIARCNFKNLNLKNIQSFCDDGIEFLKKIQQKYDLVFVDPSRRDSNKNKVFLLQDLLPNPALYMEQWLDKSEYVMLKLSPMLDIKSAVKSLGKVSQIHIVAVKNEVKELLIVLTQKETIPRVFCVNLRSNQPVFSFEIGEESSPVYTEPLSYIYEPNAAIMKSGGFAALVKKYKLKRLHPNTQLFTSEEILDDFPGNIYTDIESLKKPKKELSGKSIRLIHRNFPEKLTQLKQRYKFKTDGTTPIIFTQSMEKSYILKVKQIR